MKTSARIDSRRGRHEVTLATNDPSQSLRIAPKPAGFGSSASGGDLLFQALATCYCNDIHREAARRATSPTARRCGRARPRRRCAT